MTTVYIFGAGASHSYNQSPSGIRPPLARGFFETFHQLDISADPEVRIGDIVNHLRDVYGLDVADFLAFNQDIEQFMTHLDIQLKFLADLQARDIIQSSETLAQFYQSVRAYDQMLFMIAHVLNEIQNGPVSDAYNSLVGGSDASDTFITFNWDTLLDRAIYETGSWVPDKGYGVRFLRILDRGWREPAETTSTMQLLKLHGSTNWLVNYVTYRLDTGERVMIDAPVGVGRPPNSDALEIDMRGQRPDAGVSRHIPGAADPAASPICVVDPREYYTAYKDRWRTGYRPFSYFFPPDHPDTGVPLMPLIVAPVLFKMYEEFSHVLDPIWEKAHQAVSEAERIVIVGYSFPRTDFRAIDLLRQALATEPYPEVTVVNPDADAVRQRLGSLGFPSSKVRPLNIDFTEFTGSTCNNRSGRNSGPSVEPSPKIVPLSKSEFNGLAKLDRLFATYTIAHEREWYKADGGEVLGIVIQDRVDTDWVYVVLGPDERGEFRSIDVEHSIVDRQTARKRLHAKMAEWLASGKRVFAH